MNISVILVDLEEKSKSIQFFSERRTYFIFYFTLESNFDYFRRSADIALLLTAVTDFDSCGIANINGIINGSTFAVVHQSCATGSYSFAHEIAHLFGAHHNRCKFHQHFTPAFCANIIAPKSHNDELYL
jgi:hypothetical protein